METKQEYIDKMIQVCKENNIYSKSLIGNFEQEWFENLLQEIKQGKRITKDIYNSLDGMQKYYIDKHYTIQGINVVM